MAGRLWRLVAGRIPNDGSVLIFLTHNMLELPQMMRGIGLGVWESDQASFHAIATSPKNGSLKCARGAGRAAFLPRIRPAVARECPFGNRANHCLCVC